MQVNKSDINASPSLCCRFLTESLLFHSPMTPIPERWLWNRSPCTGLYDFDLQDEQLPTKLTSFSAIYGELRLLFGQRINFNLESISVPTLSRDLSRFIELVIEKGVLVPMALHSVVWKGDYRERLVWNWKDIVSTKERVDKKNVFFFFKCSSLTMSIHSSTSTSTSYHSVQCTGTQFMSLVVWNG